ncbi:hypothetical protein [Virgibacillus sp. CBA3643]|uniref:hypothetical protein n=1 Tax=Virgibacillus sp. CBA3643 TaxID=2942278 RepID=UPI0035A2AD63
MDRNIAVMSEYISQKSVDIAVIIESITRTSKNITRKFENITRMIDRIAKESTED